MMTPETIARHVQTVREQGFVELHGIFSNEHLARVADIIEKPLNTPSINGSKGYVRKNNIRFLFATLSWGREIIDLYTHPDIVLAIDRYNGGESHLSNFRIYRTYPSGYERMQWHVDNKIDIDDAKTGRIRHELIKTPGIIFIMYLSDVQDGGFQIVRGSHRWSAKEEKENWDDREGQFAKDVVTFNDRPRGTAIIYDYRCIHRAKPYRGGQVRTSLFGQYSPASLPIGEPILLNARDLDGLNDMQKRVLNFGKPPSSENWPIGDPAEVVEDMGCGVLKGLVRFQIKKAAKFMGLRKK